MAFGLCLGVAFLLSVWPTVRCDLIADGVHMECRDRHFMIAVDLSLAGDQARFEAVDRTGAYTIAERYAAECGYSVGFFLPLNQLVLRASYFSCHTERKDDEVFMFNFKLIVNHEGEEATYALNMTCSPPVPWSHRELICEDNYMEVSMRSEMTCPSGAEAEDWDAAAQTVYSSATSDWQVVFQRVEQGLTPMNISEAHKLGYVFDLTRGRLVFRTPYGQPHSSSTRENGVPVEVVYVTLFSKQGWVILMVDMMTACSIYEGSFDDGYMIWDTPDVQYPQVLGVRGTVVRIGANGKLVEQGVAEERGYIVERLNTTVQIRIPHTAEGVYKKSIVSGNGNVYSEYYIFHLYVEQVSVDEDHFDTRLCFHRTLATPLLPCPVFTEDRTVLEEHVFTVYLGNVPEDAKLAAVHVNGHQLTKASSYTITEVAQPNNTRGYTLKMPFEDPVVVQQFLKEDSVLQYMLDINYTLAVYPENEQYYSAASVTASVTLSPPAFDAACYESGISFKLDHQPFDERWEICIGPDLLTLELATQHGYFMSNDSQSLLLNVPLFAHGYEYKNITLEGFSATFEILVRYRGPSEVQNSTVKTCRFSSTEFIMCSTDGTMTVVADLSQSGVIPARTHLRDKSCTPKEANDTWVHFSSPLNSCGSLVELGKDYVKYENEIVNSQNNPDSSSDHRIILQCIYPLAGLHRLFSVYKFESDTVGDGHIVRPANSTEELQRVTAEPTAEPTTASSTRRTTRLVTKRPGYHPQAHYIKFLKNLSKKGVQGRRPVKVNAAV